VKLRLRNLIFLSGISFLLSTSVLGQDAHFSQKLAQDRLRNPSLISDFDGKVQVLSTYRQQWQAVGVPFTTSALFATAKIKSSSPALSYFIGIDFNHDRSGDAKLSFVDLGINFGANYTYEANVFGFGIGTSIVQKTFDQSGLTFPSQYDRSIGGFNSDLASGEGLLAENLSYFDLNLGLSWKRKINRKWELTAGFGLLHLLQPEESFLGQNN
jgi:type IX secretion system PorP/SprF family membrane protein